jgi:hypothetical protein
MLTIKTIAAYPTGFRGVVLDANEDIVAMSRDFYCQRAVAYGAAKDVRESVLISQLYLDLIEMEA